MTTKSGDKPGSTHVQLHISIGSLLVLMAYCCVFFASLEWVFQANHFGTLTHIPALFVPGIPAMGFGLFIVPFICLGMVAAIVRLVVRAARRPYSVVLFLGYVGVVMLAHLAPNFLNVVPAWSDCALRIFVAMALSAGLIPIEVLMRRLPALHFVTALLATATTCGYYFFLLCVVVSAGV